jgi:pyruvate ferredoxin oxidoreductase alpha subunit
MNKAAFINGNEAIAYGVKLSRPHVIAAYPITPQTKAVEKLSQFVQDGEMDTNYMHVESEHSAMACSIGASAVGARTFTATSSQGLLYMAECLPYASGARLPIVMMNANRAIATPWNIYGDQMDVMYVLNSGWVQLFVEDGQEALDMVIQSYKLAEDPRVMAPVMINIDGFVLTHTYEKVFIPSEELVDSYLPPFKPFHHMMTPENPMSMCISAGNQHNMEFKIKQHEELLTAETVLEEVDLSYAEHFGRQYGGAVEGYYCEDAEHILVTTGSVTGTARCVVDRMRLQGHKIGLLKLRLVRPFPATRVAEVLKNAKTVGVLDKNISFGYEGTIFTNLGSALQRHRLTPLMLNFIGGLGGRDVTQMDIEKAFESLETMTLEENGTVKYCNVRCEL